MATVVRAPAPANGTGEGISGTAFSGQPSSLMHTRMGDEDAVSISRCAGESSRHGARTLCLPWSAKDGTKITVLANMTIQLGVWIIPPSFAIRRLRMHGDGYTCSTAASCDVPRIRQALHVEPNVSSARRVRRRVELEVAFVLGAET